MSHYYEQGNVILYKDDNRIIVPCLAPDSVDLVVTSPPFNANMEYEQNMWDSLDVYHEWLSECMTGLWYVCAPGAWLTCEIQDLHVSPEHSHHLAKQKEQFSMATSAFLTMAMIEQGFYLKGEIIWDRGRWMNNMAGKMACAPGSPALLVQHSKILLFRKPGGRKGVYQFPEQSKEWKARWCRSVWTHVLPANNAYHPAVMPLEMAKGLILGWSLPNSTVLDPFAGIGTTLRAAKDVGRKAVGIEIREEYCQYAVRWLQQDVFPMEVEV